MKNTIEIMQETEKKRLEVLLLELSNEYASILEYWEGNTVDLENGGFYGRLDNDDRPDETAPKGIVLNSRILWSFSTSYLNTSNQFHLDLAGRVYEYIGENFMDTEFGGVYWSVNNKGEMLDGRKQVYGLAFCIYGMSQFYKATRQQRALEIAIELFRLIEKYSYDNVHGGYFEAFSRKWEVIEDVRLSEKDGNEPKTMNTHLHVIEAYSNLFAVWPDKYLEEKIRGLLVVFEEHIINEENIHLNLFMNETWETKQQPYSFGHDIEAAWLLYESAIATGDGELIAKFKLFAISLAKGAMEGLAKDGGLYQEFDAVKGDWLREKHWWTQAEGMVGFMNAWQLSRDPAYLEATFNCWNFIKEHIIDKKWGEWHWGVYADQTKMKEDKAGFWKCPYHNSRACVEIVKRINLSIAKPNN